MGCMKRLTVSLDERLDAELRNRAGTNLSDYVSRAIRARLVEDAMAQMIDQGYTPLPELMEAAANDAELHG